MNSAAITAKQIPIYCKASISHSLLKNDFFYITEFKNIL